MKINSDLIMRPFDRVQKNPAAGQVQKTNRSVDADTVAFSKAIQQSQGPENTESVDTDRNARIEDVKERISNGSYAPDSKKVAISLLKYIVKGTTESR